tara:strand:- start:10188 stop:10778 length:591 start_codon:yes stop_codon:yes gene_type:complete
LITKICEIANVHSGHPFRGAITPDEDGDVHVVQVKNNLPSGEIIRHNLITTTLKTKKTPDWLLNGDILFIAKGSKNFSSLVQDNLPQQTVCSSHFFLIRVKPEFKKKITPEFLCWQLNQQPAQRYFKATAEGSMHLSIRRQVLENAPIKVLTLEKQKQLTAMHRCGIKEIKVLQKLIDNRQKQLETIAIHALENVN